LSLTDVPFKEYDMLTC